MAARLYKKLKRAAKAMRVEWMEPNAGKEESLTNLPT
jgi:hypothetical protein